MNRKLTLQPHPDVYLIHRLLFRLLPVQILLAAVSQINGSVSSLFASNYIGDRLGTLGLALASSTGLWVFLLVEAFHFLAGRSIFRFHMRFRDRGMLRSSSGSAYRIPLHHMLCRAPGKLVLASTRRILRYVGELGISASSTANSFLGLLLAVPNGMLAVSRMAFGVSIGEKTEDADRCDAKCAGSLCSADGGNRRRADPAGDSADISVSIADASGPA